MPNYASVVFNIAVNREFQYEIPSGLEPVPGVRVRVPFRNSIKTGLVTGLQKTTDLSYTKKIFTIIDAKPLINPSLIELAKWISESYLSSIGKVINLMIPLGVRQKSARKQTIYVELAQREQPGDLKLSKSAKRIIDFLSSTEQITMKELLAKTATSRSAIDTLLKHNLVRLKKSLEIRNPFEHSQYLPLADLKLTGYQITALAEIAKIANSGRSGVILIHGVTGSGKTEIYIRTIQAAIQRKQSAIVLVPEISLTPQTVSRFKAHFAKTAVLHSMMTTRDRAIEWKRIRDGEVDVVIGTRSAVFAPLENLGVIVIDEEHETSYKEHQDPRYCAREVAIKRVEIQGGVVILGSATPSLETFYNAKSGRFKYVSLPERVQNIKMPSVQIIDMHEEHLRQKRYPVISNILAESIGEALAKNEQVIIFLNRRGFSTFMTCMKCGLILKCRRCDIVLAFHKDHSKCLCHYCLEESDIPEKCPRCFGKIRRLGIGTQRVEEEIARHFPKKTISRMDSDSMRTRFNYKDALGALVTGKTDILIGTQMIAKGLDIPNVTLVGIISADTPFNVPDFRSAERTFQLVTQVAGRAGRGPKGGKVLVQTHNPTHYSIICASTYNYEGFAQKELKMREELRYPPFAHLVRIVFSSRDEKLLREKSNDFALAVKTYIDDSEATVLGPAVCPIYKIKGQLRMHILIKAFKNEPVLRKLKFLVEEHQPQSIRLTVDVDPVNVL